MLDFLVGRVLIPWVLLRPWLAVATDGDRTRPHGKRKQKICHNIRAVATLLYKALRAVALTPRRFSLSLSLSWRRGYKVGSREEEDFFSRATRA